MDAPRDQLIRANCDQRATAIEGRTMVGYPIVFDTWTTINSWEGQFKERVAAGATNRTIKNNRGEIRVLFNHGMDPSIGDKPLGKPDKMRADEQGLYTETPLSETSYNDDLIALMRDGAIDGMSFRFSVLDEQWVYPKDKNSKALPERTITELRLYEYGPVTFPAYEATSVGIRSRDTFDVWLGLDDEQRHAIRDICGLAVDLGTLNSEPATGTSEREPAIPDNASSDRGVHLAIHRHRAAVAKARIAGAITP